MYVCLLAMGHAHPLPLKNAAAACTRRYRHCKIPNMKIGKTKPILVTYSVLCNSWWCQAYEFTYIENISLDKTKHIVFCIANCHFYPNYRYSKRWLFHWIIVIQTPKQKNICITFIWPRGCTTSLVVIMEIWVPKGSLSISQLAVLAGNSIYLIFCSIELKSCV